MCSQSQAQLSIQQRRAKVSIKTRKSTLRFRCNASWAHLLLESKSKVFEQNLDGNRCINVPQLMHPRWRPISESRPDRCEHFGFVHECDILAFDQQHRCLACTLISQELFRLSYQQLPGSIRKSVVAWIITSKEKARPTTACLCYMKTEGDARNMIESMVFVPQPRYIRNEPSFERILNGRPILPFFHCLIFQSNAEIKRNCIGKGLLESTNNLHKSFRVSALIWKGIDACMLNCEGSCDCIYFLRVSVLVLRPSLDFEVWMTVRLQIGHESTYDITILHQSATPRISAQQPTSAAGGVRRLHVGLGGGYFTKTTEFPRWKSCHLSRQSGRVRGKEDLCVVFSAPFAAQ